MGDRNEGWSTALVLVSVLSLSGLGLGARGEAADSEEDAKADKRRQAQILSLKPEDVLKAGAWQAVGQPAAIKAEAATESARRISPGDIGKAVDALQEQLTMSDKCSRALAEASQSGPPVGENPCTTPNLQRVLVDQRRAFRYAKKWAGACLKSSECGNSADRETLRREVDALKSSLDETLERENLREPFVAELVTGMAFGTLPENTEEGTSTLPSAYVRWRSNPFGFGYDADRDLDFTLGGRFGFLPALALVEPAEAKSGDSTEPAESLKYQEAFGWDMQFNARRHFGNHFQIVASGGGGQLILNSESTVGKFDGKDTLFTVVPNGVGRAAFFWDAHLAFRFFKSNRDVRAEQQSINPGLEVSFGVRHDSRFKPDGQSLGAYDSPERRYLFRLLLSDFRVVDRRSAADSKEAPTFTITFGVEHEFGGTNGLPAVTRLLLVGDLALIKALNGSR